MDKPRIIVSACLLGEPVRYDGGRVEDCPITPAWRQHLELVPVCPEVEVGMGVPREPIDLHLFSARGKERAGYRVLGRESGRDWTEALDEHALRCVDRFHAERVCGVVLKSRSPSCGIRNVKLHRPDGTIERIGTGRFARVVETAVPEIPAVQDDLLRDGAVRDAWLESVFFLARLRQPGFPVQRTVWQLMLHGVSEREACRLTRNDVETRNRVDRRLLQQLMGIVGRPLHSRSWSELTGRFLSRYGDHVRQKTRDGLERVTELGESSAFVWRDGVDLLREAAEEVGDPDLIGQSLWQPWSGERSLRTEGRRSGALSEYRSGP